MVSRKLKSESKGLRLCPRGVFGAVEKYLKFRPAIV